MGTRDRRAIPAALVVALLGAGLSVGLSVGLAAPASADVIDVWKYDTHAAGMPSTEDPARTLVSGEVNRHHEELMLEDEIDAHVELGAEPDPDSDATLRLVFGEATPEGCTPQWELSVSTYDPAPHGSRDGTVIRFGQPLGPDESEWSCSYVELTGDGPEPDVLDRLDGHYETTVIVDPPPGILLRCESRVEMPVRTWAGLTMKVNPRFDVVRAVVKALPKEGVRSRDVVLGPEELDGQRVVRTRLPLRLGVDRRRTVKVVARAWNDEGDLVGRYVRRVTLVPRR